MTEGRAASVHDRLLVYAKKRGEDFTLTLTKCAIEHAGACRDFFKRECNDATRPFAV